MLPRLTAPAFTLSFLATAALALAVVTSEAVRVRLDSLEATSPTGVSSPAQRLPALDRTRLHHLFGLPELGAPPALRASGPRPPFAAKLLGTMTSSVPGHSVATLLLPSGRATSAWEGEWLLDGQIVNIAHQFITVRRDGVDETLYIHGAQAPSSSVGTAPVRSPDGASFTVSRAEVLGRMTNLVQLASEVHVVPAFKDGVPVGFRLFAVRPDWSPGRLGVQSGDVIRAVNGQPLDSMERVLALSALLQRSGDVELELERAGRVIHQRYRLD